MTERCEGERGEGFRVGPTVLAPTHDGISDRSDLAHRIDPRRDLSRPAPPQRSALVGSPEDRPTARHADCTCLQARARRCAVGRVSRLRRFATRSGERRRRPKCKLNGNLEHARRINTSVSAFTPFVFPHLSTCFRPSWTPSASFVLHTIQSLAPQPFDRALARNHEQG